MTCTLLPMICPPLPFPSPSKREGGRRANLVRSGSQFVLPDLFGRVRLALNSSGSTVASAVFDSLGVQRHGSGTLASGLVRNAYGAGDEDGLAGFLGSRSGGQDYVGPDADVVTASQTITDCAMCLQYVTNEAKGIPNNAIRHCTWGCKAAKRCGKVCAMLIYLKEFLDLLQGDPHEDIRADMHNNGIGISLGLVPVRQCKSSCEAMKRRGVLR